MPRKPPDRLPASPDNSTHRAPDQDTTAEHETSNLTIDLSMDNHKPRRNMHNPAAPKETFSPRRIAKTAAKSSIADDADFRNSRRQDWRRMPGRATRTVAMPKIIGELEKGFLKRRAAEHRKSHGGLEDEDMAEQDFNQDQYMPYVIPDLAIRKKAKEGHPGLKDMKMADGDNQSHKPPQQQPVSPPRFSALALSMRKSAADFQAGQVNANGKTGARVCKRCFCTINTRQHCVDKPPCHFCRDEAPYCQCLEPAHISNI